MSASHDQAGVADAGFELAPREVAPGHSHGGAGSVVERILQATEGSTLREIAARTRYHPETVRRYFRRGRLSLRFFSAICEQFGVSPEWLLWGTGPMRGRGGHPMYMRTREPTLLVT